MAISDDDHTTGALAPSIDEDVGWEWERDLEAQGHGGCWERSHLEASFGEAAGAPRGLREISPLRRTDVRLYEDVCELLAEHPLLDASAVEVEVVEAIVILRGVVCSDAELALCRALLDEIGGLAGARLLVEVALPQRERAGEGDGAGR